MSINNGLNDLIECVNNDITITITITITNNNYIVKKTKLLALLSIIHKNIQNNRQKLIWLYLEIRLNGLIYY